MAATLTLNDVRKAWYARDPRLITLIEQLCNEPVPPPETPVRDGALTFDKFLAHLRDWRYKQKSKEEQAHYRVETLKALEAPDAEVPLADKLKVHEVIWALWESNDPLARDYLLRIVARVPLVYGPWKALKKIFKESEAKNDTEVYGAVAARLDMAHAGAAHGKQVSGATVAYLVRRAWRYLRRVGLHLPATYPDVACEFLVNYTDEVRLNGTWVFNHILFHDSKKYGRSNFRFGYRDKTADPTNLKHRAYGDTWKRSHRPLFSLLERAKSDAVRDFATTALKTDFRQVLRDTEPAWVVRLVAVPSRAIHDFVVWLLQNVPQFEQSAFRALGLHDAVLRLFESPSADARKYAANYARTHARDLPLGELIRLANNDNDDVRKLATDLLGEKDPRTGVGLDAWGQLLETPHGHKFAADSITKHFGANELTPEWFQGRLLSRSDDAFEFAKKLLPKTHDPKVLGAPFFIQLLRKADPDGNAEVADRVAEYATEQLGKFDLNAVPQDQLHWLALLPASSGAVDDWLERGKLKPQTIGTDFLKALAFAPDWDAAPWLAAFKAANGQWSKELSFDEGRAQRVLRWFADVRKFANPELGLDWLLRVAARSEPMYHDFASDRLIRTFVPAEFAPQDASPATGAAPVGTTAAAGGPADLGKASFCFTGTLANITAKDAEARVKGANGTVAANVSPKLHYLVVGDSGSPFLGQGQKGAKYIKAEELNANGANISIISETMFLQMLSGHQATASGDAVARGCERLWQLVVAPGPADAPVGKFAREYLRKHHPNIAQKLTDKPVDPGAEVPASFLTLERVLPLFSESRKPLREFALELAGWEFARWNPGVDHLVALADIPFMDVRRFVAKSLLAEDTPQTRPFRLDPAKLEASAVYRFCESNDEETRALGMELINRLPKLRVPEELFRLSESPDRKVRAFVIRALWTVYRDRGLTPDWKPPLPPKPTVGAKAKKDAEKAAANRGEGVPHRPETWPAEKPTLSAFLRRILFELPPGRPEKSRDTVEDTDPNDPNAQKPDKVVSVKPLPARRAKLDLIEVMRDLGLEDKAFGGGILPLLDEFMLSRGVSERAACLVAVTRIRHKYPEFKKGSE
ncbi:BRCT domain-containing protein [Gemmata sp. JC717]|uniref:BRCT domain-containing protein n=1 Tax=Gemmata algarum TaxID=2975278 RepID=UPI0021BA8F55|nr:BRCT domain-containing protein [Gemmata algarum]MDY3551722.1 BRCT domain-containing protein [Gemmata algarum]